MLMKVFLYTDRLSLYCKKKRNDGVHGRMYDVIIIGGTGGTQCGAEVSKQGDVDVGI